MLRFVVAFEIGFLEQGGYLLVINDWLFVKMTETDRDVVKGGGG